MSYLGSILARAMGTATVLQPRLPSRYERDAAIVDNLSETISEREALPPPPHDTPMTTAASASQAAPSEEPQDLRTALTHVQVTREIVEPIDQEHAPPEIIERENVVRVPIEHSVIERERIAPVSAQPTIIEPERVAETVTRHESRIIRESRIEPRIEVHERQMPETAAAPEGDPPLRALLAAPAPRIISPHAAASALPVSAQRASPPEHRHEPPPEAPTIRVTIGRVDVRAVSAQTPKRAPAASPPSFTLDDYIRLRKGERR